MLGWVRGVSDLESIREPDGGPTYIPGTEGAFDDVSDHPMQPVELDGHGVARFRANQIVEYLLDEGGLDLNMLARHGFPNEDWEQFYQLIGYSVSGYGDLSQVSDGSIRQAEMWADNLLAEGEVEE